jgi:hypothetical protein
MDFESSRRTVNIGSNDTVYIEKMYGPTIFCKLKVTADVDTVTWRIEREWIKQDEADNDYSEWEVVAEFGCQDSISFRD